MSRKRVVRFVGSACVAAAILFGIAAIMAGGSRAQFSPDTLECRGQREVLLPFTEIPLYRSGFHYFQNDMIRYLMDRGYWSPREVSEPRWISLFRYNAQWRDGWSSLQHDVFWHPEKWIEWTEKYPRLAAVIWPQVLLVLRNEKYGDATSYVVHLLRVASEAGTLRVYEQQMAANIDWPKDLPYLPE